MGKIRQAPNEGSLGSQSRKSLKAEPHDTAQESGFHASVETIDPVKAGIMLENVHPGLAEDRAAIDALKIEMRAGKMIEANGNPICFDKEGQLTDGLKRLKACVETGISFQALILRNLPIKAGETTDQHRKRTYINALDMRGERHPSLLAIFLTRLIEASLFLQGIPESPEVKSWSYKDRVLTENPDIRQALDAAMAAPQSSVPPLSRALAIFQGYRGGHGQAVQQLMSDISNPHQNPNSAGSILRAWHQNSAQMGLDESDYLIISALRHQISGSNAKFKIDTSRFQVGRPAFLDDYKGLDQPRSSWIPASLKKKPAEITVSIERVTPEIAGPVVQRALLQEDVPGVIKHQRRIVRSHVEGLRRTMDRGLWRQGAEGQVIIFDKEGNLRDGLQRLTALVEGGHSFDMMVVRGVDPAVGDTYDVTNKKTSKSWLGPMVEPEEAIRPSTIAAAIKLMWDARYAPPQSGKRKPKPTLAETQETLKRHPSLGRHGKLVRDVEEDLVLGSQFLYAIALIEEDAEKFEARDALNAFLEGFRTRLPQGRNSTCDAIQARLLRTLGKLRRKPLAKQKEAYDLIFKEWQMFRAAWREDDAEQPA